MDAGPLGLQCIATQGLGPPVRQTPVAEVPGPQACSWDSCEMQGVHSMPTWPHACWDPSLQGPPLQTLCLTPSPCLTLGPRMQLWVSSTQPGTASLERIDLASGAVQSMHPGAAVTALCADASSRVWLGHKDGRVSLWTAAGDPGPSISCGRSAISCAHPFSSPH